MALVVEREMRAVVVLVVETVEMEVAQSTCHR